MAQLTPVRTIFGFGEFFWKANLAGLAAFTIFIVRLMFDI